MSVQIQINVNCDSAAETLQELKTFTAPLFGSAAPISAAAAPASASTEAPKQTRQRNANKPETAKPETTGAAEEATREPADKAQAEGSAPVTEETGDDAEQDEDGPIPTIVNIRAKAAEAGKQPGGREKVKALLDKFEVPNVSGIPEDKRAAFMRELEALA